MLRYLRIFSNYKGTDVVPVLYNGKSLVGQDSIYASATIDKNIGKVYIKLVNISSFSKALKINLDGISFGREGSVETLKASRKTDFNSMTNPALIFPTSKPVTITGKKVNIEMDPISVNVLILNYKK